MIREVLAHLHWSTLPVISMFLFLSVFVGVLLWVFRKESSDIYNKLRSLPLDRGDS